eukprot:CAMPEP_0117616626 /NCGR_PEP_ID=MMETSP0784-20121206/85156_1 /TAXON_ID=39447 /ORGANISM="" /LENGTH=102 /DNA_ID=CAMNT_0005420407 /DNA_START=143 /DNA_END=448 /DNA_ORIENTATION=+
MSFTLSVINDRDPLTKIKHVCLSQGLSVRAYWLGSALAHYFASLPCLLAFLIVILAKSPPGLNGSALPLLVIMIVIYPLQMLLYAYTVGLMFSTTEIAVKVV